MDFASAAKLGAYVSKDHARGMFELLTTYHNISASEAASRLGIHIRTAQDFLETMESLGILSKEEVYERKRPYYRYRLVVSKITMEIDLAEISEPRSGAVSEPDTTIREMTESGAVFAPSRTGDRISAVTVWTGAGRTRKEKRLNLTNAQGTFLFHLPFPNATPLSTKAIMEKAGVDSYYAPEIDDLLGVLVDNRVIEVHSNPRKEN